MEGVNGSPRKLKFEQLRADYELFLQTFEKPSWLYRYLSRRNQLSPIFLNRNLTYLKERRTKREQSQLEKRTNFRLNCLLSTVDKKKSKINEVQTLESCLDLTFGGFFHGPGFAEQIFETDDPEKQIVLKEEFVKVDLHLIQVYHKRKKDAENDTPMDIISLGSCKAPWNPRSQLLTPCPSFKLTVPAACFSENGRSIKTHIISITISVMVPDSKKKKAEKTNKKSKKKQDPLDEVKEPPRKRIKSDGAATRVESTALEKAEDHPTTTGATDIEKRLASFSAELIVFDRYKNCLLSEGDYELLLQENQVASESQSTGKKSGYNLQTKLGPFEAFCFGPTIKFRLRWDAKPLAPLLPAATNLHAAQLTSSPGKVLERSRGATKEEPEKVFYQFIYNSSTRQQTEAREGFSCPWCSLDCIKLYGLLRHLKCCHYRFSFMYTALKSGHRIDVCINDSFDGSMKCPSTATDVGFVALQGEPIRRQPFTQIIVGRPKRKHTENLLEFSDPGYDVDDQTSTLKGHDRQYYHSADNQPILGNDMSTDSDIEYAPEWLKDKTTQMIEEFTDVNAGEKELMKMWNIHILEKGYISDTSITTACITFVETFGRILNQRNLQRNFLLHLNNLFEFQVIPQSTVINTMHHLKTFLVEE